MLKVALALAGTVACGLVAGLSSPPAASGEAAPVSVRGHLLGVAGRPSGGTRVALYVEHTDPTTLVSTESEVAITTTDARGGFSLPAQVQSLPRDSGGGMELQLTALSAAGGSQFWYGLRVLPDATRTGWQVEWPTNALRLDGPAYGGAQGVFQVGRGLLRDTGAARATVRPALAALGATRILGTPEADDVATTTRPTPTVVASASSGPSPNVCQGNYTWLPTSAAPRYPMVPTHAAQTTSKAQVHWEINRTQETSLEVEANAAGSLGISAGFTSSIKQESGLRYDATWGHHRKVMLDLRWVYIQQQMWCSYPNVSYAPRPVNDYRWMPDYPDGGSAWRAYRPRIRCGSGPGDRSTYASTVSVSEGTTAEYDRAFSINGVSLGTRQSTTSAQVFTVDPDPNKTARFCGTDNSPIHATLVKETD